MAIRLGGIGLATATLLFGGIWAVASGWAGEQARALGQGVLALTVDFGFGIEEVLVTGRERTDAAAVLTALDIARGDPILAFSPDRALAAVTALPWVSTATVERRLPDTIVVHIEERRPLALWQNDEGWTVIDAEGVILVRDDIQPFVSLPMVIGSGAADDAATLLAALAAEPAIEARVEAAIRRGDRRWDLRLDNGVDVRLPETGVADALRRLTRMDRDGTLFQRDQIAIDLRTPDRVPVRLSAEAAEHRRSGDES
ncbi:MAG: cell division protein FtsQ/DivIB [Inquilinaceae bacterium]